MLSALKAINELLLFWQILEVTVQAFSHRRQGNSSHMMTCKISSWLKHVFFVDRGFVADLLKFFREIPSFHTEQCLIVKQIVLFLVDKQTGFFRVVSTINKNKNK